MSTKHHSNTDKDKQQIINSDRTGLDTCR